MMTLPLLGGAIFRHEEFGALGYRRGDNRLFFVSPCDGGKLEIEKIRLKAPICITWQITTRCNLSCVHCFADSSDGCCEELDMPEIRYFLDDLSEMGVFYINLGGGEPLLHPHFFEIVDYAAEKRVHIQFSTNGTMVDSHVADEIAKRGLRVQVSLDGWEPSANDAIRGAGTFHKALNAIRLLREKDITVAVNCVVTSAAVSRLDEMFQLATSYGAKLRLSRLRPVGRAQSMWRKLMPSLEEYRHLYQWLIQHPEVNTGDSFFFLSPMGISLPGLNFCGAGKLTCSVDPRGFVYPCPFTLDPLLVIGNIREEPLSRIWKEASLSDRICSSLPTACMSCSDSDKCNGGCRGMSFLVYHDWNQPDPDCIRRTADERFRLQ